LQADENERSQHAEGAGDLCHKGKLLECHQRENS
jgi:hypothetical protein